LSLEKREKEVQRYGVSTLFEFDLKKRGKIV